MNKKTKKNVSQKNEKELHVKFNEEEFKQIVEEQFIYGMRLPSMLSKNPRIVLLESHLPNLEKKTYRSFIFPQENQKGREESRKILAQLFTYKGGKSTLADAFLNSQKAQVSKEGVVRIFSLNDEGHAYDYAQNDKGNWEHKKVGPGKGFFFSHKGKSKKAYLFSDP